MDENHQSTENHNLVTTENKLWLPPSFTNGKSPINTAQAQTQKKTSKKWRWGFSDKTGWDWLNLVGILLVPLMIGIFTVVNSIQQNQIGQQQYTNDQKIVLDQQRETTLKTYLDDMKDLLLNHGLGTSKSGDAVRQVARVETLTALERLDSHRKGILLHFLYEANLIKLENVIVDLTDANLSSTVLNDVSLLDIDLSNTNLSLADLAGNSLVDAQLTNVNLDGSNLKGASLMDANMDGYLDNFGPNFFYRYRTTLVGADLENAVLEDAKMQGANLSKANLSGTDLIGAHLRDANLQGANLSNASNFPTLMMQADLTGAHLSGANLQGVNLIGVALYRVDLSNADLRNAKVTSEQLSEAYSLKGAIMPNGSVHP